ncbi:hypothetical protein F5Y07DRAFT_312834 [Xylaria sp. FL0933]|nr:hypothetical protein F5Y07DRAFT_312834 [Xylaria sp. FL0933]
MAVPGSIQALIAAFLFGILFNTASIALVLYTKSHGSAIYRDGLRLVLILFFLTSSSWALVEFLATLIDPSAIPICQVAVIFSSLFDQFGRAFVEQYLVWAVPKGGTKTVFSLVPQILVFGRFFVGIGFTAVTRTQFKPTCAPVTGVRAVSITSIALDGVIIGLLLIQAFSNGTAAKQPGSPSTALKHKPARLIVVGVALWWGTSVASLLGLESIDLFYRTALPGIGLTVLVALVTILSQAYTVAREFPQRPDSPVSREARDLSSSGSADYPPSRYEDLKEPSTLSVSAFAARIDTGRGIRRNNDGTFPTISRPMTAGSDRTGNPIQEQLFPTVNSSDLPPGLTAVPPLPENWGIFKSASGRTKLVSKSRDKTGKLVISKPILNEDENMQNSLKRMPTIDLAEAAINDRARREKYAQRLSTLVAQRPAPKPPSPSRSLEKVAAEAQVAGELERSESIKTSSGLSVEANASSTATSLSPGVEAVRRRSPRQPEPAALATPFRVIRPGEPIRIPIPRQLEREPNPPPPKPEPVKTPLQRRPTTGLPSNPRAQTLKPSAKETDNQKTQTVMFVNNIVYSDPNAVGDIIQEATKIPQPPDSADSVVNRPRPIPRKGDKDRQVFPAEISPNPQHRRTKSGGSIVSRKSILQVVPGSPTGLPSLPPIPSMDGIATRSVSNNTKSMTVEEKMNLLYSTQPSAPPNTELSAKRRSSLPNLSPFSIAPKEEQRAESPSNLESNDATRDSRGSKRTTARTSSLLGITDGSQSVNQDNLLTISFNNRDPNGELGNSWLPGISAEDPKVSGEVKRRSSPVIPIGGHQSISTAQSETRFGDEETITNWGSVYSPAIPVLRQNARSTYIKGSRDVASFEDIPIMMADEFPEAFAENGPSLGTKTTRPLSNNSDISQGSPGQFHHRPGDECPTFSARKEKTRPRKMPPPTPLLLTGQSTKREIIVQAAEPSPIESPRVAYEAIQAQLRNFEKSDSASVESSGQRLALLANLEQEMGQLESKWQTAHDNLARDSISSVRTSISRASRPTSIVPTLAKPSSQRSSFANTIAERRASRRARMRRSGSEETADSPSRNSSQNSENFQAAFGQTGLDGAHMGKAPELLIKHNHANILSISKASLGNPSPPETDGSDFDETPEESVGASSLKTESFNPLHLLWSREESPEQSSNSWLWEPKARKSQVQNQPHELPGSYVRSATRKHLSPLAIKSSRLWQSESKLISEKALKGLWIDQPSRRLGLGKAPVRPPTIRPPRKNKRVTLLPDIIENPEPLPNKRGTLGIFQFPWGEKSENATFNYYPSQVFMPRRGTMTTGNPVDNAIVNAEPIDLGTEEYSSSFFDDYDEGDNFSDFSGGGDDEFDETTLWEIASLLQTDQIPSKNSLLLMPLQSSPSINASVVEDYMTDIGSDDEDGNEGMAEVSASPKHIMRAEEQKTLADYARPLLWTPQHNSRAHVQVLGLPQQESWNLSYNEHTTALPDRVRAQSRVDDPVRIQSTKLWSPILKEAGSRNQSFLWAASTKISELQETHRFMQPAQTQRQAPTLWSKSRTVKSSTTQRSLSSFSLPEPEAQAWQQLVSQTSTVKRSKPRMDRSLPSVSSSMLWSRSKTTDSTKLWTPPAKFPTSEDNASFRPGASTSSYRTTTSPPAALLLSRRMIRHVYASLEPLESATLWSLEVPTSVKSSTAGLWRPMIDRSQATRHKSASASAAGNTNSTGLWRRPEEARPRAPLGLFDPKAVRYDFRRTSEPPAAICTTTRPRLVREDASILTSGSLWAPEQVRDTALEVETPGLLWRGNLSTDMKVPVLFRVDTGRTDYRSTTADPAALMIVRRPRVVEQRLQSLQSSQLWVNGQVSRSEIDWIAVHTTPSSSPSLSRDNALAELTATELPAATSSSKGKGGFFSNWFGKKTNKGVVTTATPEVQLRVANSSHDLAAFPEDIFVKNLDEIPHVKPTHTALRHRYRPTTPYNANWDAALAEAVLASYPRTIASRASYPRDWDAQLDEAISASYPTPVASGLRATPADWSLALHQAVTESYPEVRHPGGQTLAHQCSDVAIRHPVFFGSLATTAVTVHPALTGYHASTPVYVDFRSVKQESSKPSLSVVAPASLGISSLWTKPLEQQANLEDGLWTSNNEADLDLYRMPQYMQDNTLTSYYPMKANKVSHPVGFGTETDFRKQGLWKRSSGERYLRHPSSLEKNWLDDSVNKRFSRIELRY